MRLPTPLLALALFAGLTPLTPAQATTHPPLARWLPRQTLAVVSIDRPYQLLDLALNPRRLAAITALPAWKQTAALADTRKLLGLVTFLEKRLCKGWQACLRHLLGGGITVAIGPDNRAVLCLDAADKTMLHELHRTVLDLAGFRRLSRNKAKLTKERWQDVDIWRFGQGGAWTLLDKRLLLADRRSTLEAILKMRTRPAKESVATLPAYTAAMGSLPRGTTARVFLHLQPLKALPGFAKTLAGSTHPLGALVTAGMGRSLAASSWVALGGYATGSMLRLEVRMDGKAITPPHPAAFGCPATPGQGVLPNLKVPGRIAAGTLFRDFYRFYAAKDKLFPERTSALIFFENMMGIYFSGRDLTEEVLGELEAGARFVVAEQRFDPKVGTPRIRYPAFALVLRLKDPAKYGIVVEEAWQKALGMVNFTRGQKGHAGLIIDKEFHEGIKFSVAYFSTADAKDRKSLDDRFNFRPSLAVCGDSLILSSTDGLTRDLITALKAEAAGTAPISRTDAFIEISGKGVHSILKANRESMVRQAMLDEGATRPQAERKTDLIHALAGLLKRAWIRTAIHEGRPVTNLTLFLNGGR